MGVGVGGALVWVGAAVSLGTGSMRSAEVWVSDERVAGDVVGGRDVHEAIKAKATAKADRARRRDAATDTQAEEAWRTAEGLTAAGRPRRTAGRLP